MNKIFHIAYMSLNALADNAFRSILSILGVATGIAAVIIVGSITSAGNHIVFSELKTFGLNSIWIFRDYGNINPNQRQRSGTGINNYDYKFLISNCCKDINAISAVVRGDHIGNIRVGDTYSDADIYGVDKSFLPIENDSLLSGRFFSNQDIKSGRSVAVIAPKAARDLFGNTPKLLGKKFNIGRQKLTIIGVLNHKNRELLTSIGSGGADSNNRILLPYTLVQRIKGTRDISFIKATSTSIEKSSYSAGLMVKMLERKNKNYFKYKSETMSGYVKTASNILNGVSFVGVSAAAISLIVGGLGIMNIMSTAVIERTREIGLRKAIGAKNKDILIQFLIEAKLISIIGSFLGVLLGVTVNYVIASLLAISLPISISNIFFVFLITAFIGISAGYIPASKAAKLAPVEALRYE